MTAPADFPLVLTVDEAAAALRVSRWRIYESVKAGELRACRLGRTVRIPRAEIGRLLGTNLEESTEGAPAEGAPVVPLDPARAGGHRPR
jgi:excisionase family DNA binding protein